MRSNNVKKLLSGKALKHNAFQKVFEWRKSKSLKINEEICTHTQVRNHNFSIGANLHKNKLFVAHVQDDSKKHFCPF